MKNGPLDPSWDSLGMFSTQDDNPFLCCHPEQDSFKSVSAKDLRTGLRFERPILRGKRLECSSRQDDNPFLCCHPEQDSFKSVSAKDLVRGSLSSSAISRRSSPNVFVGDPVDQLDSRLKLAGMTNHFRMTTTAI